MNLDHLSFEIDGALERWKGGPRDTLALDTDVFRTGTRSARIHREPGRSGFSTLTTGFPATVDGSSLVLSGWLRIRDVRGYAGLWLRTDGPDGAVAFVNMHAAGLRGTRDWARYSVPLPFSADAREIVFGAQLVGDGTLWVDDLQLELDGRPVLDAPRRELPPLAPAWTLSPEFATGSGIDRIDAPTSDLVLLGKVWGFAKYHHPAAVAGTVNMDEQLFRLLPRIAERPQDVLCEWLDGLGPLGATAGPLPDDVRTPPDTDWLSDVALLGRPLSDRLREVHARRPAVTEQHYVAHAPGVGNPVFAGERAWSRDELPDAGLRLLALFRFWNVVAWWFPYRTEIGEDWDAVLADALPSVCGARDRTEYVQALMVAVARVGDSHTAMWNVFELQPPAGSAGLPIDLRWIEGRAVVTGVRAGPLRVGDVLETLEGAPVEEILATRARWYGASNEGALRRDQLLRFGCGPPGPVRLAVRRGEERLDLACERVTPYRGHPPAGPPLRRLSSDLALLDLSLVPGDEVDLDAATGARALVIDLRRYPAWVLYEVGGQLVAEPRPFARFVQGDASHPGAFVWGYRASLEPISPRFEGRVAILVDERTQSRGEYTAMALRAVPGAILVGSATAGADGNVSTLPLPGRLTLTFTGIGVFWPDGRPTQRVGLQPDVEVRPTIEGIRQGRDELLEAAVRALLGREMTLEEEAGRQGG